MTKINDDRYKRLIAGRQESARLGKVSREQMRGEHSHSSGTATGLLKKAVISFAGESLDCDASDIEALLESNSLPDQNQREQSRVILKNLSVRLLREIKQNPNILRELDGHLFEDVIAEILCSLGFSNLGVRVRTKEGEVDLIGFSKDVLGNNVGYVFELKQRGKSRKPVSVSEVRGLYAIREGLRTKLNISQGVFATTTTYTRNARQYGSIHQLSLKDFDALKEWVDQYHLDESGLYLLSKRG